MTFNIFRPLSNEEKKDMILLGETDLLDLFLGELANKKTIYQKQYRPFDTYCARVDFDDKIAQKISAMKTTVDKNDIDTSFDFGDLNQYAKPDRFRYDGEKETKETKLVAGIKQEVLIGHTYTFHGRLKGNRINIFVPNEDTKIMEDFLKKNYSPKAKKVEAENEPNQDD